MAESAECADSSLVAYSELLTTSKATSMMSANNLFASLKATPAVCPHNSCGAKLKAVLRTSGYSAGVNSESQPAAVRIILVVQRLKVLKGGHAAFLNSQVYADPLS